MYTCMHQTASKTLLHSTTTGQKLSGEPLTDYQQTTFEDLHPAFFYPLVSGYGISVVMHSEVSYYRK